MEYEVSTDPARLQLDAIWEALRRSYWSPGIRRDVVARAVAGSLCAGAYDASGGQVGFARLITDRATFAYLCDVYVLEAHRKRGLATRLCTALIDHPDLATIRRVLLATRDAHGLYRTLGFSLVDPDRWMERKAPASAWSDPPGP